MSTHFDVVSQALQKLDAWIEKEEFKGWASHDALNSPLLKWLTFNNRLLGIVWVQLLKRSPVNVRPLLGITKGYNPKGMGLFLASYVRKYQMTGSEQHWDRVNFFADWLEKNSSSGHSGAGWGYNFDWPNRGFFAPAGTPTLVNTAFIGLAFLDLYDLIKSSSKPLSMEPSQGLDMARSGCEFIINDLAILRPNEDELCFAYTPLDQRYIHNANMLGAQLLAEVYTRTNETVLFDYALAAARYTARCQHPDGSWAYGESGKDSWIDNFHTGFVLVSLKRLSEALQTEAFDEVLVQGYHFWKNQMFLPEGIPKYYPHKIHPIDSHSIAQAILTFLTFADDDAEAMDWCWRVALWGIKNMQDSTGYFHYQIYPRYRNRIPYMRWSQAWMQRALTELVQTETLHQITPPSANLSELA